MSLLTEAVAQEQRRIERMIGQYETKLWHLSIPTLYDLWVEEKETGHITYPEEA